MRKGTIRHDFLLSQSELASCMDISRSYLNMLERSARPAGVKLAPVEADLLDKATRPGPLQPQIATRAGLLRREEEAREKYAETIKRLKVYLIRAEHRLKLMKEADVQHRRSLDLIERYLCMETDKKSTTYIMVDAKYSHAQAHCARTGQFAQAALQVEIDMLRMKVERMGKMMGST